MRALLVLFSSLPAGAMIFLNAEDPPANKQTAPTGDYENAGWQWQVRYKVYLGTMISPKHFITATHLGQTGETNQPTFFNGVEDKTFTLKNSGLRLGIPNTDLSIFEIWETFEDYAPLFQGTGEVGNEAFICGRGLGRGDEVIVSGQTVGWKWGDGTTYADRWGVDTITQTRLIGENDFLYTTFDPDGGIHEIQLTGNDSGGGWFIKEGGSWKLAGVTSSVDGTRDTNNTTGDSSHFRAAISRSRGLYVGSDNNGWFLIPTSSFQYTFPSQYYTNPSDARFYDRTHSYATRISTYLPDVNAIIQPAITRAALDGTERFQAWLIDRGITSQNGSDDDPDHDASSNLLEYFANTNADTKSDPPFVVQELPGGEVRFTITESLDLAGRGLTSEIQKSTDLSSWTVVTNTVEQSTTVHPLAGNVTRVLELTPPSSSRYFYRLKVTLTD